ncbi:MAG TPA: LacI family DNA-binding transcriptional regulator [Phycisphaerae bacterium]|nr:LacI family DNA-binding transcriptional regulator [Phycisphaerae bacterium]
MASYNQIAEQAGVSITTVSRALNNDPAVSPDTRRRVLAIANRAGYVATMGRRVTTQIGFAYTGEASLAHAFDAALLEGITRGMYKCRYDVVILDLQRDKQPGESYTQFFMRRGVRGVILRTYADTRSVCEDVAAEGFPHVVIADRFDTPGVSFIEGESRTDSVRAVEYLIDLGHRRIAMGMHNVPDRDHADRFEGYKTALAKHGLAFDDALVFRQHWSLAGGATALKMAVSMAQPPTAIYFADPMLAIGAVKMCHEIGVRIPQDISIVGFDDTDLRFSVHPTLTAVCQDARGLGYEAGMYLSNRLAEGTDDCLRKTVPTYFEIHQTTGVPRTGGLRHAVLHTAGAEDAPASGALRGAGVSGGNGAHRGNGAGQPAKSMMTDRAKGRQMQR